MTLTRKRLQALASGERPSAEEMAELVRVALEQHALPAHTRSRSAERAALQDQLTCVRDLDDCTELRFRGHLLARVMRQARGWILVYEAAMVDDGVPTRYGVPTRVYGERAMLRWARDRLWALEKRFAPGTGDPGT